MADNERLRAAIKGAGLEPDELAERVEVDPKTVQRWLAGRVPHSRHRTRVAKALGAEERELWPGSDAPAPVVGSGRLEMVGAFARTSDVLAPDWKELLKGAGERIDLLDFTLAEILASPGVPALLAAKAAAGCSVRLLISYLTRARLATDTPLEEPYEDDEPAASYEIARSRGYIEPLLKVPGIEARRFAAMRFNSIVRCDDQMLVTLHLWGVPGRQAPLLHLRERGHPGLFGQFEAHYESIWDHASHPIESEPELFPDPDANPEHYRGLLFDDAPPDEHEH